MTKFYHFRQNNSGGSFEINDSTGIGVSVWVEAHDSGEANHRAEQIGIYFDGCSKGIDCSCCGDRWSEAWGDEVDGYSVAEAPDGSHGSGLSSVASVPSYVHRLDGTIDRLPKR